MIYTEITNKYIQTLESDNTHQNNGAELQFYGRVRALEKGRLIQGLEYEFYEGMAEKELQKFAKLTCKKFSINKFYCVHRVGMVPVGEASLLVAIWTKHRTDGLNAMAWFISQLKKDVPIWKNAVLEDGRKIPSDCEHC